MISYGTVPISGWVRCQADGLRLDLDCDLVGNHWLQVTWGLFALISVMFHRLKIPAASGTAQMAVLLCLRIELPFGEADE